jgi:hypothetical protein
MRFTFIEQHVDTFPVPHVPRARGFTERLLCLAVAAGERAGNQ